MKNPRFEGTYEEYQEYAHVLLGCIDQSESYDEDVIAAAWAAREDGIAAALDCVVAE